MLNKFSKGACALAAALTLSATAAYADWHSIDIEDGAYLPQISYIELGDDLLFYNESQQTHTINGPDGTWTSGPIAPGARYVHRIDRSMPLTFTGQASDGAVMEGSYSYEPAPLDDAEG